jgi:hypothetical protein
VVLHFEHFYYLQNTTTMEFGLCFYTCYRF